MGHSLAGRVALVTGSTGPGMGRSTALTLAREGADVALNYGTNRGGALREHRRVLDAVRSFGVDAILVRADTRDGSAVRRMFARAKRDLGAVDILVNNAGGAWDVRRDLTKVDDAFWHRVLGAEIDGMIHATKAALPDMRRRGWGRIVNLGMERSEEFTGPPYDYTIGKIARHGLTRILAEVEVDRGITINAVAPGYIPYFTLQEALRAAQGKGTWRRKRHGTPQDVAELIAFLCSDAARYVNAAIIPVHGAPFEPAE